MFFGRAINHRDAPYTNVPDYKQEDPRWAEYVYSDHGDRRQTIATHGCGLCAMADIIAAWFDPSVTPVDMAKLSMRLCTVAYDGGTLDPFFWDAAKAYPFSLFCETGNIDTAVDCLETGGLVIAKFDSGVWNPDPERRHACCIYAYTDGHFWLHDSGWPEGLMSDIMGHGTYDQVKSSAELFWCFWR